MGDCFLKPAGLRVGAPEVETNRRYLGIQGQKSFLPLNGTFQVAGLPKLDGASQDLVWSDRFRLRPGPPPGDLRHQQDPAKSLECPGTKHLKTS